MKKINVLFGLLFLPLFAFAQTKTIYPGAGTIDINAGVGFGHYFSGTGGLPIGLSVDYGWNENVSVGGYFGYVGTELASVGGKWSYSNTIIGVRGSYHKYFVDNFDTYGGAMLGYNMFSASWSGGGSFGSPSLGGLIYGAFAGARYSFTDQLAAFGEIGYGIAVLQVGVSFRL